MGTGYIKAGFMSDSKPEYVFPNIVANDGKFFGKEALAMVGKKAYPMINGQITDWSAYKQIMEYTIKEKIGKSDDIKDTALNLTLTN